MGAQPAALNTVKVGDIAVTYLPDGDARISPTLAFPTSNDALWAAHPEFLDESNRLVGSIGGFLIETAGRTVLVDLGFGDREVVFPPLDGVFRGGRLLHSLGQVGVSPVDIDTVFYTHLHLDHVGWTSRGGSLSFPDARYLAGAGEWEFWRGITDKELAAGGPDPETVQAPLENRLEPVADGGSIAPGVTAAATPGHTHGHTSLVISSGTNRAIILGDAVHCPLQFDEEALSFVFDVDPALARRTRERMAAELEDDRQTIAASGHFADAVFGRLVPGRGKRWASLPGRPR